MEATENINVVRMSTLDSPAMVKHNLPITLQSTQTVIEGRHDIQRILNGEDKRLLVVAGPCSISDEASTLEYAHKLNALREQTKEYLCVVMRTYFEKPRTNIGWKGFINDSNLDGGTDINTGLAKARNILLSITDIGMPTAMEMVDPITPQYVADLICWSAVGARTTESQVHRTMASGFSMPVGFKNNPDGNVQVAVDALITATKPHVFFGINDDGNASIVETRGNEFVHVILRGSRERPNYQPEDIEKTVKLLKDKRMNHRIMIDCSHANSRYDHPQQVTVWDSVMDQYIGGNRAIMGLMLESYLFEGRQDFPKDLSKLKYGVSITDACIGWETTEQLLLSACERLSRNTQASPTLLTT